MALLVRPSRFAHPSQDGGRWHAHFRHLASYGGGYYSYLWARALSLRVWRQAFEANPLSRDAGERWCNHVLRHGGARDPRSLMRAMLGETEKTTQNEGLGDSAATEDAASLAATQEALLELVDLTEVNGNEDRVKHRPR